MSVVSVWEHLSSRLKLVTVACAALAALVAAGGTIGAAWGALGLPRPIMDDELTVTMGELRDELRHQSIRIARSDIDSRSVQIDADTLTKSRLMERQDEYRRKNEPVPDWLIKQIHGVTKNIDYNVQERKRSTDQMEKDSKR